MPSRPVHRPRSSPTSQAARRHSWSRSSWRSRSSPFPATAAADPGAPWDGTPISAGLGPTYGEDWCQPPDPGTAIAGLQGAPLAIIPYEAIHCTVDQILAEGVAAGIPARATYEVNTLTDTGREQLAVVVNALETPEQQRDYERWTQVRELMTSDPAAAQDLLATFGTDVKMPIFIEANIHGGEREGTDAMLQVLRDLVTTPYGDHPVVDDVLDHSILIIIPSQNPDGRYLGTRANSNGFDMNRDLLVQSQPEIRANIRLQLEWLAPVMFAMHGYVNPDPHRWADQAPQPRSRVRHLRELEPAPARRERAGLRRDRAEPHPAGQRLRPQRRPAGEHRDHERRDAESAPPSRSRRPAATG